MKKVLFSVLAAIAVLFTACGPSAVGFNDALNKANDDISRAQSSFIDNMQDAMEKEDYASINVAADSTLTKINSDIDLVKALEAPEAGAKFKETALKTFECAKALVETGKEFAKLTASSTEEEHGAVVKLYEVKYEEYSKAFDDMSAAQAEYAKETGYEIEK